MAGFHYLSGIQPLKKVLIDTELPFQGAAVVFLRCLVVNQLYAVLFRTLVNSVDCRCDGFKVRHLVLAGDKFKSELFVVGNQVGYEDGFAVFVCLDFLVDCRAFFCGLA